MNRLILLKEGLKLALKCTTKDSKMLSFLALFVKETVIKIKEDSN